MTLKDFIARINTSAEKMPEKIQELASMEAPLLLMDVNY